MEIEANSIEGSENSLSEVVAQSKIFHKLVKLGVWVVSSDSLGCLKSLLQSII
jgi:hypothetical protein